MGSSLIRRVPLSAADETFEICNLVTEPELAKKIIIEALTDREFKDYLNSCQQKAK